MEFENSHPSCAGGFGWRCLLNAKCVRSLMTTALLPCTKASFEFVRNLSISCSTGCTSTVALVLVVLGEAPAPCRLTLSIFHASHPSIPARRSSSMRRRCFCIDFDFVALRCGKALTLRRSAHGSIDSELLIIRFVRPPQSSTNTNRDTSSPLEDSTNHVASHNRYHQKAMLSAC